MSTNSAPFSSLTPDLILDAISSVDMMGDGRLLALNSYENRVYQVGIEDAPAVIVKFYRPQRWSDAQIMEEHEFSLRLAEAEIPVVAPLVIGGHSLQQYGDFKFAVFPRRGGRIPELDQEGRLEWIGRFLGRIHAIGALEPFQHRPVIDIASFGEEPAAWLLANKFIPADLEPAYRSVVEQALEGVRQCYARAGKVSSLRLHGDCHLSNLLWTDDGPHFVDFDDSRTGPAIQDLWMLLSGDRAEMNMQLGELLEGYECFHDFNPAELHLVEALRTLRLIHYSAWIARRWDDPAFPMTFTWFNTQKYWQDRILELREQIALMEEPPLSVPSGNS
ncbi:serine/threonine protein kinase [Methylobacillus gramineus]|uniref:serine/threonine protein kinase n=1 Tax=Methylobacillus gramineus TaxID=755169 RepID=UPI001D0006EC|nr:serine/threonine protein kinase [Methylobacillus gramineus]MCB5184201.1 serine/threonine protein kinase [Methylobacillus gramineus]